MPTALYRETSDIPGPHHRGPLHSGDPDQGTEGTVVLAKRISIDASRGGDFVEPIKVPPWSLVTAVILAAHTTFNGGATMQLGTTPDGTEVLTAKAFNAAVMQYFSPATAAAYIDSGNLYLKYIANSTSSGAALVIVQYVRIP